MRSDAKDVGIGKAVPLAQWKSLMPLVRTAPGPGRPIHRVWRIKASALLVTWGAVPPQPQTTIARSKKNASTQRLSRCQRALSTPGVNAGAGRAIRSLPRKACHGMSFSRPRSVGGGLSSAPRCRGGRCFDALSCNHVRSGRGRMTSLISGGNACTVAGKSPQPMAIHRKSAAKPRQWTYEDDDSARALHPGFLRHVAAGARR
jgi:hypothetical protein